MHAPLPTLEVVHEPYPLTDAFRADWRVLHAESLGANVFTTLEWLEQGWRCFAPAADAIRPVRFVDARGRTAAMALHRETAIRRPWGRLHTWRTLDYNSQRIAPLLARNATDLGAALAALHRSVGRRIDVFDFFKLDALGGRLDEVCALLAAAGLCPDLRLFNEQPQLVLGESWDDYRHSHNRAFWKTRRRLRNKLGREVGQVRHRRLRSPADFRGEGRRRDPGPGVRRVRPELAA